MQIQTKNESEIESSETSSNKAESRQAKLWLIHGSDLNSFSGRRCEREQQNFRSVISLVRDRTLPRICECA